MKFRILKKFVVIFTLIFTIVSCDLVENKKINIPKIVIQSKVDKKFPITKKFLVGNLTLENPKVNFKEDKMYIETNYIASLIGAGSSSGKMYISTGIKYDVAKENMYLTKFSIDKILDEDGNEVIENVRNIQIIKEILTNFMGINPVYEYRKENPKTKIRIKKMYIKDDKFFIQT